MPASLLSRWIVNPVAGAVSVDWSNFTFWAVRGIDGPATAPLGAGAGAGLSCLGGWLCGVRHAALSWAGMWLPDPALVGVAVSAARLDADQADIGDSAAAAARAANRKLYAGSLHL